MLLNFFKRLLLQTRQTKVKGKIKVYGLQHTIKKADLLFQIS